MCGWDRQLQWSRHKFNKHAMTCSSNSCLHVYCVYETNFHLCYWPRSTQHAVYQSCRIGSWPQCYHTVLLHCRAPAQCPLNTTPGFLGKLFKTKVWCRQLCPQTVSHHCTLPVPPLYCKLGGGQARRGAGHVGEVGWGQARLDLKYVAVG